MHSIPNDNKEIRAPEESIARKKNAALLSACCFSFLGVILDKKLQKVQHVPIPTTLPLSFHRVT